MSNAHPRPFGLSPILAGASALTVALVLTLGLIPAAGPSATADLAAPSYAGLRPVFRAGEGKQIDEGQFELYCDGETLPSGWLWAEDDTRDGNGTEYWVLSSDFAFPGPDNDGVQIQFDCIPNFTPQDLTDFVGWIVNNYGHIQNADELSIHVCRVSLIE